MVKGMSRRVVVVESPDQRFFEQAIFILRSDAATAGVSSREVVEEARRVARDYAAGSGGVRRLRDLPPLLWALCGAGGCGLVWLMTLMV